MDEHFKTALNMITAPETKKAFAIEQEETPLREAYGRNKFGQSCLLARRLVESGVRFVTVTDGGWDTHANNFKSLKDSRMPPVDKALPQLSIDLEQRGLLANTLVCWFSDFGRTPKINSASGRDHWATAGFAVMAGAGIPGGHVLGSTDEEGGFVTKDEYGSEDLAATIYKSDNTYHVGFVQNGDADHLVLPDNTFFAAATYTMIVGGKATGRAGGLYNIAAVTAPVPEPETWGMLLAGLGLVGLRLRRHMRTTAVLPATRPAPLHRQPHGHSAHRHGGLFSARGPIR